MKWFQDNAAPAIRGGLSLPRRKYGLPLDGKLKSVTVPARLVVPLLNYQQEELLPSVTVDQQIRTGEPLATGVISPADGRVIRIGQHATIHPSSHTCLAVEIAVDPFPCTATETALYAPLERLTLERIERCGIVGLGGAGFETTRKLAGGRIHTLVINAVECEPLISCDESLLMSDASSVVQAIHCMIEFTQCNQCVLAIENDKVEAIALLSKAMAAHKASATASIDLFQMAPIYPSGAERPLIERITGRKIPDHLKPVDQGIICLNVATVHALWRARHGYAMISRIISVTGSNATQPCNVRVRLGTSVEDVLHDTGNAPDAHTRVRAGGPLSGFDLADLDVPVRATTNCIALEPAQEKIPAMACIRCGDCSTVCPAGLLPQQLLWYTSQDDAQGSERFGLASCIECGCCDVVCPSSIQLTQTFRYARSIQREKQRQDALASAARQRYQNRQQRLQAQENAKQQERLEAQAKLGQGPDAIADALKRARTRKRRGKPETDPPA